MPETTPSTPIDSRAASADSPGSVGGNRPTESHRPEQESTHFDPIPRHIAIIMDGNGRWARQRGKPRTDGHTAGAEVARDIAMEAARLGVQALTLYSFSTENWKRPREEIDFLMKLGESYLRAQRDKITESNIRFRHIGSRKGLSDDVLAGFDDVAEMTAHNTGMTLGLAINYGSRVEITEAVQSIAERVQRGELSPDQITEQTIEQNLYTAGMPEPDLLIRTAGEMRLSNFLLWQISYAELWVTPTFWPSFSIELLHEAIADYNRRQRRFGAV